MKAQTFQKEDKYAIAYYNERGDFISIEEKEFYSLAEANNFLNVSEETEMGEIVKVKEEKEEKPKPKKEKKEVKEVKEEKEEKEDK